MLYYLFEREKNYIFTGMKLFEFNILEMAKIIKIDKNKSLFNYEVRDSHIYKNVCLRLSPSWDCHFKGLIFNPGSVS